MEEDRKEKIKRVRRKRGRLVREVILHFTYSRRILHSDFVNQVF